MKKLCLLFYALTFFFFVSSCDGEEENTIKSNDGYIEYVTEKLQYYNLKEDVESAERIYYKNARWDYENKDVAKNLPTAKEVYYFDRNGALTKIDTYSALQDWDSEGNIKIKYTHTNETSYRYDEKYRLLEYTERYISSYGGNTSIKKTVYTYDDRNKRVTVIRYNGYDNELEPFDKIIYSLDENGRIDYLYQEYYRPKEQRNSNSEKPDYIEEKKIIFKKDHKNNPILYYTYTSDKRSTSQNIRINEYCEQTISYYDGSVSNNIIDEEDAESKDGLYITHKASELYLKGNVKSLIEYAQLAKWDKASNTVIPGDITSKISLVFDPNGLQTESAVAN